MLYTDGTTEATEQEILDGLQAAVAAKVNTWVENNTPKLKMAIDAGDLSIVAVAGDDSSVERVEIGFDVTNTTGDRQRLMKLAAALLSMNEYHPTSLGDVNDLDIYRVQTSEAQRWAQRVEACL